MTDTRTTYPLLFSPGRIGSLQLRNRFVLPAMLMGYGSPDGYVTERAKDYYGARAAGGAGLVIVEASMPQPDGKMFAYYLDSSDDRYLPGLTELAGVIKSHGAAAAIQLGDGGRETRSQLTGRQPMGPSPDAARERDVPREMTHADIAAAVENFAAAAHRVQRAGFDGVEIHGAHVYLLNQFLSASVNHRTDSYGGSIENRFRIVGEVLERCKQRCGADFPVWLRLNAQEYGTTDGLTIEDSTVVARLAQEAGFDAVSVTAGSAHYEATFHSTYTPQGLFVPLARAFKSVLDIPVIVTGRMTVELGEQVLADGDADFIAFGRPLIVDPELPNKAAAGRLDDIVPCDLDLNCVHRGVLRDTPVTCTMNPALGREREFTLLPAADPGHVVVIGGGPAGLEAARVAALRGHRVTLLDRGSRLGGQLLLSARAPQKGTLLRGVEYYERQLSQLGVDVRLGVEAGVQDVLDLAPTAVVLATGAARGAGGSSAGGASVADVDELLADDDAAGDSVVIWGADNRSMELADLLSEVGRTVTLASAEPKLAPAMLGIIRGVLVQRLRAKGVREVVSGSLGAVTADHVEVCAPVSGRPTAVPAATLAFAAASLVDQDLLAGLRRTVPRSYVVGSCVRQREHQDAIADGARVGRLL